MPLDDLVSVIETLKARLQEHREVLQANETRTRMALIDPLLQALGWDTADPALVLPEYDLRGNRADYALLGGTGKPAALVEAKRLGEQLVSHRMQIVNYANLSGVPYAGLTDGNHWELYKVFDPAPIEDRLLLNISIADRPAHEVALKLLLLWQPNLAAGQPVAANEPVLAAVTEPVAAQTVAEPEIERPPAPTLERAGEPPPGAGWVPLSELDVAKGKKNARPVAIRISNGSIRKVKFWWQLPEAVIKWLWSNENLTRSDIPVKLSEIRHLVNTNGKHPTGKLFDQPQRIDGTPLILEKKNAAQVFVRQIKMLLQECGVDLADVQLQFGEHLSATVTEIERPPAPTLEQASEPPPATAEERLRRAIFGSEPPPTPAAAGWVPLSELSSVTGKPPPTAIRFPDGSTREVKSWWRLPQAIAGWLWSNGLLTMSNIPVEWGKRRYFINTDGQHPTGVPFDYPKPVAGTPLVLEAKISSKDALYRAKELLRECGVNRDEARLHFAED